MKIVRKIQLALILCFAALAANAGVSFVVQAPSRVYEGNKFNVAFVLSNAEGSAFTPPEISWAKKLYGPALSTSYSSSWVNGKTSSSSSQEYTMIYKAGAPGRYTIGAASVVVDGKRMTTRPISIEVVANGGGNQGGYAQPPQPQRGNSQVDFNDPFTQDASKKVGANDLFVRIEMSKPRVYEQQAVVCTIKLYTKYQISKFMVTQQPSFDGFLIEEINMQPSLNNEEVLNGQTYHVAVLKKCILYPQQSGKLTITSGCYDVNVVQYERFNTIFGSMAQPIEREMKVKSNQATVAIQPLPEPKPATFTGAVGKFTVRTALNSNDLKTYKASVFSYIIQGTGNIKYIKAPSVPFPKQFDVYDPKNNVQTNPGSGDISGTVKIDYTFIPQFVGDFVIPASKFTFFNPETGHYETVDVPQCKMKVAKGEGTPSNHYKMQNMDIRDIVRGDLGLNKEQTYFLSSPAYWLWYILPLIALAVAAFYYRNWLRQRADVRFMRNKRAGKVANKRLKAARACMVKNDTTGFYAELLTALWGYLSDKLDIPVSELSKDNIQSELDSYGVDEELRATTIKLLDKCEFAQYAPQLADTDMAKVHQEAADLIGQLENVKRKTTQS